MLNFNIIPTKKIKQPVEGWIISSGQNLKHLPNVNRSKQFQLLNKEYGEFDIAKYSERLYKKVRNFLVNSHAVTLKDGIPVSIDYYLEVFPIDRFEIQYENLIKNKHFRILSKDCLGSNYVLMSEGLIDFLQKKRDFQIYINNVEVTLDIFFDKIKNLEILTINNIVSSLISFYNSGVGHIKINDPEIKIFLNRNIYNLEDTVQNLRNNPQ